MQTANILLSLGGDHGNTIMKHQVTAAEITVLMSIHGNDAVNEVEPAGEVKRSHREERGRLLNIYGHAKDPEQKPIVEGLFPGVAARVFETIDELGLDESMFKATGRLSARPDPSKGPTLAEWLAAGYKASNYPPSPFVSKSTPEEIAAAVAAEKAAEDPAPAFDAPVETDEEDDGVGEDMTDGLAEKPEDNILG